MNKKILSLLTMCLLVAGCNKKETSQSSISSSSSKITTSLTSSIEDATITISEAIRLAQEAGENGTTEEYQIKGTIKEIADFKYGAMTIEDSTGSLYIYGVYGQDRKTSYENLSDKPVSGDEITLIGKLKTYKGTPEMDRGYIVNFRHVDVSENIDLSQYQEKTISEVREIEEGTKVKVSGFVSKITYAFGMQPNGFYLIDNASSIYVYDTQFTSSLSIGNKVTIVGEKDYYVLGTEQNSANKYGYKGCCQISSAYLLENDKGNSQFSLTWCEEKTIKEILDTPVTENITTNIYKVNALVSRQEGKGFVNYYFYDLDGTTGSYAYTQCNGSDFEYLKEFDNKICTVYLSPINCKSTDSGCFYRFVPINVSDDNYQFDVSEAPNFAIEYYVIDQFSKIYYVDPEFELTTNVSSSLLGFESVEITYISNNEDVVYFEEREGKTILHTGITGSATITINAKYSDYETNKDILIEVVQLDSINYTNVKSSIEASDGDELIVRGVVASSLVNKDGFYLIDETGLIAVEVKDRAILSEINIGNEVIISGTKEHQKKTGKTNVGQSVIGEAELVANLYGNNEYSTESFKEITFDELYTLSSDVNSECTTQGYRVTGKIIKEASAHYTNFYFGNGSNKILFYSGNGETQYGYLLNDLVNQEVTLEVALCNWNSATSNRLTILAVVTSEGKIINTCNWN